MVDLLELLALACVGLVCGLLFLAIRVFGKPAPLLPPQRYRPVPWTGAEIFLVLIVLPSLVFLLVRQFVISAGLLDRFYGPNYSAILQWGEPSDSAFRPGKPVSWFLGAAPAGAARAVQALAYDRLASWVQLLSVPCEAALILFFFAQISRTRPEELGLTSERFAADTALGAAGWLVVAPAVWLVNILVFYCYRELVQQTPQEHPLTHLVESQAPLIDWGLLILLTVAAAPFLEELVFRGVLQQWLSRRFWGGWAALFIALMVALATRVSQLFDALLDRDVGLFLSELAPFWFVLILGPGILLMDRLAPRLFPPAADPPPDFEEGELTPPPGLPGEPNRDEIRVYAARAWYGTAVLFAAAHSGVWPSPVPLFVLALALGWLALRAQSLVPSMVLHGLFNAITCLALIFYQVIPTS